MRDEDPATFFLVIIFFVVLGALFGNILFESSSIQRGRNEGIVFCIENKKSCEIEYTYLKLKENQNAKISN